MKNNKFVSKYKLFGGTQEMLADAMKGWTNNERL